MSDARKSSAGAVLCGCGHAKRDHDTGWDAAGCMVGRCTCRSFKAAPEPVSPVTPEAPSKASLAQGER